MKEATGELNLTIIVVLAIGILVAFFYYAIWPMVNDGIKHTAQCNKAICKNPCNDKNKNICAEGSGTNLADCYLASDPSITFKCPWKG